MTDQHSVFYMANTNGNLNAVTGTTTRPPGTSSSATNNAQDQANIGNRASLPPNTATASSRPLATPLGRAVGSLSGNNSLSTSRSPSANASPIPSRDSSPAGRAFRQQSSSGSQGMRSRKNSHEVSPHRPSSVSNYPPSVPSAAAIQRALSAATAPSLQSAPTSEPSSRIARPARVTPTSTAPSDNSIPSWPISPRLKSPPPSGSRRNSLRTQKKPDVPPNIVIQNATPTSPSDNLALIDSTMNSEPTQTTTSSKGTGRGASGAPTLETVQESSAPSTPSDGVDHLVSTNPERKYFDLPSEDDRKVPSGSSTPRRSMASAMKAKAGSNSDSDNAGKKDASKKVEESKDADNDPEKTPRPKTISSRTSFSSLRQKTGTEPVTRNMTVETETVNSVAQSTLGPVDRAVSGRMEHGGTLRAKASNDTIKPNKGRKKTSRKAPSINATTASTRADIFEDRVKNAMDEATSDDSDETFVYESNPPEPSVRRSRHHSRTPSGASLASIGDSRTPRSNTNMQSQKKTSMKFANAYNSADDDVLDRQDGTIRANNTRNGGSSIHHHHTGRPTRGINGHASILDDDGPFPQLNKVRSLTGLPGRGSQNTRMATRSFAPSNGSSVRKEPAGYMSYDLEAEGGDDERNERTPLMASVGMGTVRTARNARRPPTRGSRVDLRYPRRRSGFLTRFAGCIAMVAMIFLLIFGIVGFLFVITTPLTQVSIQQIDSVLASEQEIMFNLVVGAVNPNLLPISISDLDIDIFAKSKFVGSEKWWREHPGGDRDDEPLPPREHRKWKSLESISTNGGIYIPTEPLPPPDNKDSDVSRQTMLLGSVDHFDNPLTFDPSFLKRHVHLSTGGIRLSKPGNHSELGGSERWERVLLHEFDLIVRGTLLYSIPLGGKGFKAIVVASVRVKPEDDSVPGDDGNSTTTAPGEVRTSSTPQRWTLEVEPLKGEEEFKQRLKRRAWARVLRCIS